MKNPLKRNQKYQDQHDYPSTAELGRKDDAGEQESINAQIIGGERMSTKKPTILIADDEPPMLTLFSQVLEMEGFEVLTARDGPSALKVARRRKSLALVILELEAAQQQGMEICHRLREFSDVPVIILAAKYEDHDIVRCLEAGADRFVTKPLSVAKFLAQVKDVLR